MIKNPRFPHTCVIYREEAESSFDSEPTRTYLYGADGAWGECRKESSTSKRHFETNHVYRADYRLSLPGSVTGILAGDLVDVTDLQGTFERCTVSEAFATNLGTSVFFNLANT